MTREYTCKLLDLIDQGMMDTKALSEQLLMWLSEDDAREFYYANGFADYEENEE